MGLTLAEKIIAHASGQDHVKAGDIVTCDVDLAMIHDSGGPRRVASRLEKLGVGVWDTERVVLVSDHYAPAVDEESKAILQFTREWAHKSDIRNFYDQQGVCHIVLPENGHLKPGMFVVGGDSHSPTGGAFGCYMFGVGATDMCGVLATGQTWIRVPETILVEWNGTLPMGTSGKDMMLATCAAIGMNGGDYQAIQYTGSTIKNLPMFERMTMSNMAAELGAQTGLIAPDETTIAFIKEACGEDIEDWQQWQGDDTATYRQVHSFNAHELSPQIAIPHSPANARPVAEVPKAKMDQCYIGACTGAKLNDLQMAAQILKGRKVSKDTKLLISPSSTKTTEAAAADGTLDILIEAGAMMLPTGCGACAGYGNALLGERETCISSTARNFKGRMGHGLSDVYLGSPYSVAAAAITGEITDPREFLDDHLESTA